MRLFNLLQLAALAALWLTACTQEIANEEPAVEPPIREVGRIENKNLDETSGLAFSTRDSDLIWAINDDGPATLYAMDTEGNKRGKVRIRDAENIDWEDVATFEDGGKHYVVVADIGDNEARRPFVTAYVVEEPDPKDDRVDIAWRIDIRYPNGPRDAESLAVDANNGELLILSKRDVPAELYTVSLRGDEDEVRKAQPVAMLTALPQPTPIDLANASAAGWSWQPTAMSLSDNGLLILTYDGVYYFARSADATWSAVVGHRPMGLPTHPYRDAESLTFGADSATAYMTLEGLHPPLLRIDLSSAQ
ncbi:MAG: SdiA-regulated domain-containing protein [Pseudomonadota bacterium]